MIIWWQVNNARLGAVSYLVCGHTRIIPGHFSPRWNRSVYIMSIGIAFYCRPWVSVSVARELRLSFYKMHGRGAQTFIELWGVMYF